MDVKDRMGNSPKKKSDGGRSRRHNPIRGRFSEPVSKSDPDRLDLAGSKGGTDRRMMRRDRGTISCWYEVSAATI